MRPSPDFADATAQTATILVGMTRLESGEASAVPLPSHCRNVYVASLPLSCVNTSSGRIRRLFLEVMNEALG